jgi:transcription initiation factor TFIIB
VGALGLPKAVEQTGRVIASQCFNKGIQGSWGVEYTAAATVVVASRLEQCPRTREEYVSVMNGSSRSRLDSAVADIKRRLDINLPPPDPESYLARFASQLDLTAQAEHEAKQLLSESSSQTIFSGNSPPKVAATALYAVSRQPGTEEVTQQEVAKETGVSVDTIRRLYNRFRDSL